jgi:hypothetical protein
MGGLVCAIHYNAVVTADQTANPTAWDAQMRQFFGNTEVEQSVVNETPYATELCTTLWKKPGTWTPTDRTFLLKVALALWPPIT